jgi:hypothetical protein
MVKLVQHDLEFILKQIKIAEAHSAAIDGNDTPAEIAAKLATLVNGAGGTPGGVLGQTRSACARLTAASTISCRAAKCSAPPPS